MKHLTYEQLQAEQKRIQNKIAHIELRRALGVTNYEPVKSNSVFLPATLTAIMLTFAYFVIQVAL